MSQTSQDKEEAAKRLILQTLAECTLRVEVKSSSNYGHGGGFNIIVTLKDKDGNILLTDSDYLPDYG